LFYKGGIIAARTEFSDTPNTTQDDIAGRHSGQKENAPLVSGKNDPDLANRISRKKNPAEMRPLR